MAERTGLKRIDRVLEAFLERNRYEEADGTLECLARLRLSEYATGACSACSVSFCDFARSQGLPVSTRWGTPEAFGYEKRARPGADAHCLAIVRVGSVSYTIDFTAAQYGYHDFPLVRCLEQTSPHGSHG